MNNPILLNPEQISLRWAELQPWVQKALDSGIGESTTHQLFMECINLHSQCWVIEENSVLTSVGITRINQFNEYKQLQIVTTTGDGWSNEYGEDAHKTLEAFAKDTGCRNIAVYGRRGWERALKTLGYVHAYSVLVKEL